MDADTGLESLPPEILHLICRSLSSSTTDIQNFRLVCRRLRSVGDEHLGASVSVCFTRASFEKLKRLATSNICRGIRSLRYNLERFERSATFQEFCGPVAILDHDEIMKYSMEYDYWKRCYLDQVAFVSEDLHTRALTEFFQKCPKLHDVVIRPGYRNYGHKAWSETLHVDPWFRAGADSVAAVRDVMRAAHNAGVVLRRIAVLFIDYRSSQFSARDLELIAATLNGTKCLSLRFYDGLKAPEPGMASNVRRLLSGAHGLTHLSIGIEPRDKVFTTELGYIFEDRVFPHLSTISLSAMFFNKDHLYSFLIAHKETLRFVKFSSLQFVGEGDSWSQFFTDISQQLPSVRKFMLYGHFSYQRSTADKWNFGTRDDGFSTLMTHAMDKFIRKGGVLPATDDDCRQHVPDVKCISPTSCHRKCVRRFHESGQIASNMHIEEPDTDTEYYEDKDDEDLSFWKTHDW